MTLPRALGFIRTDISGSRLDRDRLDLRNYADANGLALDHTLVIPANVDAPIFQLLEAARTRRVDVIIVPSLDHVRSWKRAVTEEWELHATEDGGQTWKHRHSWEPQAPAYAPPWRT